MKAIEGGNQKWSVWSGRPQWKQCESGEKVICYACHFYLKNVQRTYTIQSYHMHKAPIFYMPDFFSDAFFGFTNSASKGRLAMAHADRFSETNM